MRRQTVPRAVRAEVIRRWGNDCWLMMPGCTGKGEEDDHVVPYSHRGAASVANIRRACKHCNSMRQDRVLSGFGATLHAVIGPPSCDLMGAIEPYLGAGSIVVSHAELMGALCAEWPHGTPSSAVRSAAGMAWDAAYRRLSKEAQPVDVWFIRALPATRSHPRMLDEWVALDYDIHVVDDGAGAVMERLRQRGDAKGMEIARQWYAMHITQDVVDARLRARHARLVELGLRNDGTAGRVEW